MTFFHGKCKVCGAYWTIGTVDGATKECLKCGAQKGQWRNWSPITDKSGTTEPATIVDEYMTPACATAWDDFAKDKQEVSSLEFEAFAAGWDAAIKRCLR